MARRSTPCTQADVTRLLKAVLAAGLEPGGVKLTKDGVEVLFGESKKVHTQDPSNEWDEVLKQ